MNYAIWGKILFYLFIKLLANNFWEHLNAISFVHMHMIVIKL